MKASAVYAGSFDPLTNGHLDVIQRAGAFFDKIFVVVAHNTSKEGLFLPEERLALVNEALQESQLPFETEVCLHRGLVVDFCQQVSSRVLIRGIRAVSDFEREFQISTMNRRLDSNIETFHVMTSEKYFFVSSSLIKELGRFGASLEGLLPECVGREIKKKFNEQLRSES